MTLLFSCHTRQQADLIVYNAKVYTVDNEFSVREAFAVRDGRFIAIGDTPDILGAFSSDNVIDAGGNAIYPGLIDGHCHYYGFGIGLIRYADLTGTGSFDEIIRTLTDFHETHPYTWIIGRGWDQNDWEVKEFPDNELLDKLFPDNPVMLTRVDGHAVLANSEALRRAGISLKTEIPGGEILKKNDRLTGILIDNAIDILKEVIPDPDPEEMAHALAEAQKKCFAAGLTSVVDAGLDVDVIDMIDSLHRSGRLKMRINAMVTPTRDNLDIVYARGPYATNSLTVNSIKLYADGALGSRGALLLEPYSDDPDNRGLLLSEPDYFREVLKEAYDKGFQVNTHCIGDSANRLMLNLYGEILRGRNDRRWRIEHAQIIHPDDFQLFGKFNILPSVQATHATSDMYWADERVGEARLKGAYALRQLMGQNGWLVNGTDFPVENINPFHTFYASVFRKDLEGMPEGGFRMENALSREEALRSITIWAARGSFEEDVKGSIEPGKLADFIVTDRDIMQTDEAQVPGTTVLATYLGGEKVY